MKVRRRVWLQLDPSDFNSSNQEFIHQRTKHSGNQEPKMWKPGESTAFRSPPSTLCGGLAPQPSFSDMDPPPSGSPPSRSGTTAFCSDPI